MRYDECIQMRKNRKRRDMAQISVCMIVKNEEKVLKRCLDSLAGIYDELIIVDTGSTDSTKEIASAYTDLIFDFPWVNDFSKARNFAFSKATMEYVYSADADEVLDEDNRRKFLVLKENILPEIEIVQMLYSGQLKNGSVYNYDCEYRPKLFKRVRTFTWVDPVHETMRLDPVVYDSDIVITHEQEQIHAARDFAIFQKEIEAGNTLSERIIEMYGRELYLAGAEEDLEAALPFFEEHLERNCVDVDCLMRDLVILTKGYRMLGKTVKFFTYALRAVAVGPSSEICEELALYYDSIGNHEESAMWEQNAKEETKPVLALLR